MAASIPLTGLSANDPVPGNYIEILFAQGPASLGSATYSAILIGNKLSTGSATTNTVVYGPNSATPLATETDCINLFGAGSELHRMFRRFTAVNTVTPLYAIAVPESSGNKAAINMTLVNTATANGSLRIWVEDEFVDVAIASGDTIATISANAVAAINAKTYWPVTAAQATVSTSNDTCAITAKQKGLRGNWIRCQAVIYTTGTIATTVTNNTPTLMTGGTTADSNSTALATIASSRYYYQVSAAEDATQLGALAAQMDTLAAPIVGIRQRAFGGSVDTNGNATTITVALNTARTEVVWLQNADWTPAGLASNQAAVAALFEVATPFRCNFSGFGNDSQTKAYWKVPAPRTGTIPSRSTLVTSLNNGLTPIGVNANGSTYLVKRITTKCQTSSVADYRIRDSHKVTVCDRYADDLLNKLALQFTGKNLADDPATGQKITDPNLVTPRVVAAAVNKLTQDYGDISLLQNVATIIANTQVIRETSPTTRVSCRVPLTPIDILDQIGTQINQVG